MCYGFGGFYSKNRKVYFSEPDIEGNCHHSVTAKRLQKNIKENDLVPFEADEWTPKSFEWHDCKIPEWIDSDAKKDCITTMKLIKPIVAKYRKIINPAWIEYKRIMDSILDKYKKIEISALTKYEKINNPTLPEHKKTKDIAWSKYKKITNIAWSEYKKVKTFTKAEYEKVRVFARAEMIEGLRQIDGYR